MTVNYLIRLYFYLNNGVSILNNFRNLFLAIFAVYFALKLTSPILLLLMFVAAIPVLVAAGYYSVHHISKVSDQLATKYGTHYGIKQFELIEKQTELLQAISDHHQYNRPPIITSGFLNVDHEEAVKKNVTLTKKSYGTKKN